MQSPLETLSLALCPSPRHVHPSALSNIFGLLLFFKDWKQSGGRCMLSTWGFRCAHGNPRGGGFPKAHEWTSCWNSVCLFSFLSTESWRSLLKNLGVPEMQSNPPAAAHAAEQTFSFPLFLPPPRERGGGSHCCRNSLGSAASFDSRRTDGCPGVMCGGYGCPISYKSRARKQECVLPS